MSLFNVTMKKNVSSMLLGRPSMIRVSSIVPRTLCVPIMSFTSSSSYILPSRRRVPVMTTTDSSTTVKNNRTTLFSTWVELQSHATQLSDAEAKFIEVMLKCRDSNGYGETLFSRYVKEMVNAMDANHDGMISVTELKDMMIYMGVDVNNNNLFGDKEIHSLFDKLGESVHNYHGMNNNDDSTEKQIPIDVVEELLLSHME